MRSRIAGHSPRRTASAHRHEVLRELPARRRGRRRGGPSPALHPESPDRPWRRWVGSPVARRQARERKGAGRRHEISGEDRIGDRLAKADVDWLSWGFPSVMLF